jgi:protein-S-isoprenylcysteine O-methyltransferase Ste14
MSPEPAIGGRNPRWKGSRGEWYVVAQVALMALVFFGPRTLGGPATRSFPLPHAGRFVGGILMAAGGIMLAAAIARMGRGLTPLPYPRAGATLVQTGPFALVRHPMYSGGLLLALGWALVVRGLLTLAYVVVLFVFMDMKSRLEERWLAEKFHEYETYRRRVRKLIPFVY